MRNLIVCADGTWNTPDQEDNGILAPTNVYKFYNCLAAEDADGNPQLKYYHPGVGTDGGLFEKALGGGAGKGLSRNIMSGYQWLARKYQEGDRIFLFGFSRGAYTVRSLGGFIARCGLLDLGGQTSAEGWQRVETAYEKGYRNRKNRSSWSAGWSFHKGKAADSHVDIHFIGVWDTVGALGIPDNMALLNFLDDRDDHVFHDVKLSAKTRHARHAVAIDEIRASFQPTLWDEKNTKTYVKQVWFTGVHADVGGGYAADGLADITLAWMTDEAASKGLAFYPQTLAQIQPDTWGIIHNSCQGLFGLLPSTPRNIPKLIKSNSSVHASVSERKSMPSIRQGPYRQHVSLRKNESRTLSIYADQPWNTTNLYLEQGETYLFEASGEWLDASISCGPGGTNDGQFKVGELVHIAGTVLGKFEKLLKKLGNNADANVNGTRRYEDFPWFSLLGTISDGGSVTKDKTFTAHTTYLIGEQATLKVKRAGYLYCFANDAWNFYGNNKGSMTLTVTRQ